jgi:hypothetical protein
MPSPSRARSSRSARGASSARAATRSSTTSRRSSWRTIARAGSRAGVLAAVDRGCVHQVLLAVRATASRATSFPLTPRTGPSSRASTGGRRRARRHLVPDPRARGAVQVLQGRQARVTAACRRSCSSPRSSSAGIGNVELGRAGHRAEQEWIIVSSRAGVLTSATPTRPTSALVWTGATSAGLPTTSRIKKDFLEELKMVRTRIGKRKGGFYVDIEACPWFDKAIQGWRAGQRREVHNFASHPWRRRYASTTCTSSSASRPGRRAAGNDPLQPRLPRTRSSARVVERSPELARTGGVVGLASSSS